MDASERIRKPPDVSDNSFPCMQNLLFPDNGHTVSGHASNLTRPSAKKSKPSRLKSDFHDFTQYTTFHGIRFIFAKGSFLRRLIWILAVLSGTAAVTWQCCDRLLHFLSSPMATSVRVNYNETLTFPTITICNQNSFKATEAAELKHYRLIEKLYGGYDRETKLRALRDHGAADTKINDFLIPAAHRKEDMIVDCRWSGQPCGPENFASYITDYGMCFTFNGPTTASPADRLNLSSTGAVHGLRLTLNVEQYEYMPGPHDGAGMKVFLHDLHIPPLVRDLGQAVSTGSHTFMGIKVLRLDNLGSPYGECGERKLKYYTSYSKTACWLECLSEYIHEQCGCRLPYVPFNSESPPVCTLKQDIECSEQANEEFPSITDRCDCPVSCSYLVFEPQISQAALSNFLIDKFQRSTWSQDLGGRFTKAMEISHRYREDLLAETKTFVKITQQAYTELRQALLVTMRSLLVKLAAYFGTIFQEMKKHYDIKDDIFAYQEYVLRKNFLRARDAIEERTMGHVVGNFFEFTSKLANRIRMVAQRPDDSIRETLHLLNVNTISEKLRIARMARDNYTELAHAYGNATQRFRYRYNNRSFDEGEAVVPKNLVKSAYNFSLDVQIFGDTGQTLDTLIFELEQYLNLSQLAFGERYYDNDVMDQLSIAVSRSSKEYLLSKFHWYESLEWPLKVISSRRTKFRQHWKESVVIIANMQNNVFKLNTSLNLIEKSVLSYFAGIIHKAVVYTEGGNMTKLELSKIFNGALTHDGINSLKVFVASIRTRQQEINDDWSRLATSVVSLWQDILEDEDSQDYYSFKNITDFQQKFTDVSLATQTDFNLKAKETRHLFAQNGDRIFYKKLYDIMGLLDDFEQGTKVSPSFFRENMLKLDIFYRELSYEHVMQLAAYDEFALICDIGGAFGLFVGASLLSLLEIFDFILTHISQRAKTNLVRS